MTTALTIDIDLGSIKQRFNDLADKDIPFLTAFAMTRTVLDNVKPAEMAEMEKVFDRPAQWTLDSLQSVTASKTDNPITAEVKFKEFAGSGVPAFKYLAPEVEGGMRKKKSHERSLERAGILRSDEYCVPGQGVALDKDGNMDGALILRILSDVKAAESTSGYSANITARSKRRRRKGQSVYFVLRNRAGAPDGIYWRSAGTRRIKPMLIFVRAPSYIERFAAYDVASKEVADKFYQNFAQGFAQYVTGSAKTPTA